MVKVLQCHHFTGQKVLCPKNEPLSAKIFQNKLFILTKRPEIQIHNLVEDDSTKCVHIETTHVEQFHFLENQKAIVTLESVKKVSGFNVFIYHLMEQLFGAEKPIPKGATTGYHCKTPVMGFANPTCISADNQAGNIGIGTKDHVYIYSIGNECTSDKPMAPCYEIKCLMEISVSIHVTNISLSEGFVLFSSDTQVQVVQLYANYSESLMVEKKSSEDTFVSDENLPYSYVSKYMGELLPDEQMSIRSHSRTSSSGSSVHSTVSFGARDGSDNCQSVVDVKSSITKDKNHIYVASEEGGGEQDHGALPVLWMKSIQKAQITATAESLRRDEIILGPVRNHPRCAVFINYLASTEVQSGQERSILTFLFREVDQSTVTHIELRPLYDPRAPDSVACSGGLQSKNWQNLLGMLCYVSTHTEGYLYSLEPMGTQLLQTYTYSTHMIHLSLGLHQLYVATDVGIEIYTIDSVAGLLLRGRNPTASHKLCPRSREPCLMGLQPFFALASVSEDSGHVVLLSKVDGEQVWSIYVLEKPPVAELCRDMVSTAELHQSSSLGTYMYMLQQAYNYITASILLDGSTAAEDAILTETAFSLGQVNASPPDDNWQLCVPYFTESGKTFSEILQRCVGDGTTAPGRGMLNYIDFVLFRKEELVKNESLELKEKEAHLVLNLFTRWRPQLVSAVIVCSQLTGYNIEFALSKLQSCSKSGVGCEFYSKARDGLAAAILHLTLGQVAEAEVILTALPQKEVVELCVENLHILCRHDATENTRTLSPLAQLLRKHQPYTVVDTFTKSVQNGQISISSLHHLLTSNNISDIHFIQVLESLACDNTNEHLFRDIAKSLKGIYIQHLNSKRDGQYNMATLKYILPKRDGLFRDRYRWLNNMPPLQGTKALREICQKNVAQEHKKDEEMAQEELESIADKACPCTTCNADLLKLQGLTCSSLVSETLLSDILTETEGCHHLISVRLVCLLRTDPTRFAHTLFDTFPHLAAQILKDLATEENFTLMQILTRYMFERQREHQVSGDKEAEKQTKLHLKKVLDVLSETLSPEQLFQILPPDGNSSFFLRYIMRCLKLRQAQVVQENITQEAEAYLKKIMKA